MNFVREGEDKCNWDEGIIFLVKKDNKITVIIISETINKRIMTRKLLKKTIYYKMQNKLNDIYIINKNKEEGR